MNSLSDYQAGTDDAGRMLQRPRPPPNGDGGDRPPADGMGPPTGGMGGGAAEPLGTAAGIALTGAYIYNALLPEAT